MLQLADLDKEDFLESFKHWYEEFGGKNPEYYTKDRCLYWVLQDIGMLGEEPDIGTLFDLIEMLHIWYFHVVARNSEEHLTCEEFAEVTWLFMETYSFDTFNSQDIWPLISRILQYIETAYSITEAGKWAPLTAPNYLELLAGTCAAWFFQLTENEEDVHVND